MKKVFSLLKKSLWKILIIIVLLVIQVQCDLALPDYTSKIVNIGIQQSGIDEYIPEVVSATTYNNVLLLADSKTANEMISSYKLISKGDKDYIDEYPLLKKEDVYVLKDNKTLSIKVAKLFIAETGIMSGKAKEVDSSLFTTLKYMNETQRSVITSKITTQFDKFDNSLIKQMGTSVVKSEYEKIGIDVDQIQTNYILNIGARMVGIALIAMVIAILVTYLSAQIAALFARDLRGNVVNKVMAFSNKEFEDFSTASLITRSTNDIQQIQMMIAISLRILIYAPLLGVGAFMKVTGDEMSFVIGIAVVAILTLISVLFTVAIPKFQLVQKLIDRINLVSREIVTGIPVIRAFATHKKEEERFDNANKDITKTSLFIGRIMSIMFPTMMFIMNGVMVLILWVGADKIDDGSMQVGTLMAFMTYTMQIIMAFLMISMISIMLPRAGVALKRLAEVFNKEIGLKDPIKPKKYGKDSKGVIEFKDVYFRYHDATEDILEDISFKAMPGTTTAIIGSTGSGKSTLINLIPRFFDVTGGSILVDGIDVKDVKQKDLRERIGFVPQKGQLFSGTVSSNIKFGVKKLDDKEVINAAKVAQANDFIMKKKEKYDSEVAQDGTNLSGGQKQRLAIARAIAKNPSIYIFDDSFSALDYKTDVNLRKALAKQTKKSTIIIVAQRISTILKADQIVVLDQGKIAGIGTHKELLKTCPIYQEIASSQLSKEELLNV